MIRNKVPIILLVAGCLLLVVGQTAQAYSAEVLVDTGVETINVLEGTLVLPGDVSVGEIYTGNSAVLFWITKPTLDTETNTISFAGMTPGGFRGKFPLFLISNIEPRRLFGASFTNVSAYRNDDSGTEVAVRLSLVPAELALDTAPPELFLPIISSSPDIFGGQRFLSFATQDKGTGISRYEYASTWLNSPRGESWVEAEPPLVLSPLDAFKKIHIRAIDKAGNFRAVSTAGPYRYATLLIGTIILLCILLYLRRRLS